jgi:hypothetical protein
MPRQVKLRTPSRRAMEIYDRSLRNVLRVRPGDPLPMCCSAHFLEALSFAVQMFSAPGIQATSPTEAELETAVQRVSDAGDAVWELMKAQTQNAGEGILLVSKILMRLSDHERAVKPENMLPLDRHPPASEVMPAWCGDDE